MKKLGMALTALGFWLFFAALLLTVLENCATNAGIYRELQAENGLPEAADITQEEMEKLDQMLASYLSGDASALEDSPFNQTEIAHMRDVYDLFVLVRTVRNALFAACAVLLGAGAWLSRGRRLTRMCLIGLAGVVVPLAALGVWAAADFSQAFTAFHRALFDNDLWLLNPETDLLVRMLPERFFSDFAAVIGVRAAAYMAAVPLAIYGIKFGRRFV